MNIPARYIFAAIAALMATPAHAGDEENLQKLLADYDERQNVQDTAGQSSVVVNNPPCPSVEVRVLPNIVVYKQPEFDPATGTLVAGAWKQTVRAKGCGAERTLNVFLSKERGSPSLELHPMLPGTTRADYTLQKDAKPYLLVALGGQEANCKTGYVEDTRFLGFTGEPASGAKSRPWNELWTDVTCTKRAEVTMHFIPDAKGTTISASPSETKFLALKPAK